MGRKFQEDAVSLSEMKVNPGKIIRRLTENHHPVQLTNRGRGVAVVESPEGVRAHFQQRVETVLMGRS